jgi:hypothetical protein
MVELKEDANIVGLEYFIDTDPGFGLAERVENFTPGTGVSTAFTVDLDNVEPGLHNLYVRAFDENGKWSMTQYITFVMLEEEIDRNIAAIQYFINTDTGFGEEILIEIDPPAARISRVVQVDVSSLADGMHTMFVRVKDDTEQWSVTQIYPFVKAKLYEPAELVALEWFIDVDPGFGNAGSHPLSGTSANVLLPIDTELLLPGLHTLYIRGLNKNGRWGVTQDFTFIRLEEIFDRKINAIQYFFNSDTGFGEAVTLEVDPPVAQLTRNITVNVASLPEGIHTLFVRVKDDSEQWSITQANPFIRVNIPSQAEVVALEWFIDKDPGFGEANAATPGANVTIPLAGIESGVHNLYFRALAANGRWSITHDIQFLMMEPVIDAKIVAIEYFLDSDPGFGKTLNRVAIVPSANIAQPVTVDLSNVLEGLHTLFVRVIDDQDRWSQTQSYTFLRIVREQADIVGFEWFIDEDPGFGQSPNFQTVPTTDRLNRTVNVNVAHLADGVHTVFVRTVNATGAWSVTQNNTFMKVSMPEQPDLVLLEWFVDKDPGFGQSPHQMPLSGKTATRSFIINMNDLFQEEDIEGFHTLYVRAMNAKNEWSVTQDMRFFTYVDTTRAANIVKLEWFINNDPGFGNAPAGQTATFAPAQRNVVHTFSVNTADLDFGLHTLYIRALDDSSRWSITQYETFAKIPSRNIVAVEYFINEDLGFGKNTVLPVTATDHLILPINVASASLKDGAHTF